jgi:peptide/nickel transport system substrate-binding protein
VTDHTGSGAEIRTFLIADVRGYTGFTQTHGDEAAARLAARFAEVTREQVALHGGNLIELRGDEALCVFISPRAALRAATDLQRRFVDQIRADPELPLRVGIGIDAGEAVPVEDGYRGSALNLAARLCSIAKPGEVLVSEAITHLAQRVDEVGYVDRGRVAMKGIEQPVHVFRLEFELDMPPLPDEPRRRFTMRQLAAAGVAAVLLLAALTAVAVTRLDRGQAKKLSANVVGLINPSGNVAGEVQLPGRPGGIAAGAGAIWATVTDRGDVVKIDPESRQLVGTGRAGSDPTAVAVGGGGVWVANSGAGTVSWLNPNDLAGGAAQTIAVGQGPSAIAFGEGAAWVVNSTDSTLQRIDQHSYRPSKPIAIGGTPGGVAVGGGWVWVTDTSSGSVVKIDPRTRGVVARIPTGSDPTALAYGGGHLWVANSGDGTVGRIDPATQDLQAVRVGRAPAGLSYSDGGVWVAVADPAAVARVDSGLAVRSTDVGSPPQAAVTAGGNTWVTALAAPSSHRGGTLHVAFANDVFTKGWNPFDPAVAPYLPHWQMLAVTNDGLLTYRKTGGAAGLEVVPDLAVSLPAISDHGRTYTFQLRKGIHYSTGTPVRASDFRYSVERQLRPDALSQDAGGYYQDIFFASLTGYDACRHGPPPCSLAKAIEADDRTGTITIHLSRADPALPQKLATSFGDLVPPGSPAPDSGRPVPATGPYMIAKAVEEPTSVLLVRNPQFHQWSADAQPDGYPDRIRWTNESPGKAIDAIEHGSADAFIDPPPVNRLDELRTRYATLAHTYSVLSSNFVTLNTRTAPFNRLEAREAVNLAVDRAHIVDLAGGPQTSAPSCQVLPPGMFGYAPYCRYTANPTAGGAWTGPDMAKAEELVRASGTRGDQVAIWGWGRRSPVGNYVAHVLDQLGYRAFYRGTPHNEHGFGVANARIQDSRYHTPAGMGGWQADYSNPDDFIGVLLSCQAFHPGDPDNLNAAELCDPELDRIAQAARTAQATDPALSSTLWQQADRRATDQAPWLMMTSGIGVDTVSKRVGNYQHSVQWGMLLDQLWVR